MKLCPKAATAAADPQDIGVPAPATVEKTRDDLAQEVSHIIALPQDELLTAWRRHCRGEPPVGLPRMLMARALTYRVQAEALGDLPQATRRFLERVGWDLAAGKPPDLQYDQGPRLKPGTVLVREHGGVEHRVISSVSRLFGIAFSGYNEVTSWLDRECCTPTLFESNTPHHYCIYWTLRNFPEMQR